LSRAFEAAIASFDAVLTSPAIGEAPHGLADTGDAVFCTPASLFGAPAIALPAGRGAKGLPLGVQLVGRRGHDRALLSTARWVERVLDRPVAFPTFDAAASA
jgi:Asp-tRNA(Asn)/Glu-tRNA(Gln) amidotransferase A subunit family amidase